MNINGRLLTELFKTCDLRIANGRFGFDNIMGEFTSQTYNGESTIDYVFRKCDGLIILYLDESFSDFHRPIVF